MSFFGDIFAGKSQYEASQFNAKIIERNKKIKEQAIADDSQDFWIVFKLEKDIENADHKMKPDYIVMNGYKDSIQRSKTFKIR